MIIMIIITTTTPITTIPHSVRAKRVLGLKNVNVYALGLYVDGPAAKRALRSVLNAKGAFDQAARMTRLLRNQENQIDNYNDLRREISEELRRNPPPELRAAMRKKLESAQEPGYAL